MGKYIQMTFEEWDKKFCSTSGWFVVNSISPEVPDNCIWTKQNMDGENWIVNGIHRANDVGFLVTKIPYEGEDVIIVSLPPD